MLFYDYEDALCAYIRNRGFVCVDTNSLYFDERLPAYATLTPCDEVESYTNPYGDVLLMHDHLPPELCYNTVLQELVEADWSNMFSVEYGEPNPYTEMLYGDVGVELLTRSDAWCRIRDKAYEGTPVLLSYDSKSKTISVCKPGDEPTHLFDMRKDEFIDTFEARCLN